MIDFDCITQLNYENSPFLQLPAELRNRIYKFALQEVGTVTVFPQKDVEKKPKSLALLSTCRQVYSETSVFYFAVNDFGFRHTQHFPEFQACVARPKLEAIKALSMVDVRVYNVAVAMQLGHTRTDLSFFTSLEQVRVCGEWACDTELRDIVGVALRVVTKKAGLQIYFVPTEVLRHDCAFTIRWE